MSERADEREGTQKESESQESEEVEKDQVEKPEEECDPEQIYIQADVDVGVHQSLAASFVVVTVVFYDMIVQIRCTEVSNRVQEPEV
jgi:hypothetical protein